MKKQILVLAIAASSITLVYTSCDNSTSNKVEVEKSEEKVADAQKDLTKANNDYLQDVELYRKEIYARIEANERLIDELKEKKRDEKGEDKEVYKTRIEALRERNRELKSRLDAYQPESKDNWEKFKEEFNRDMDGLGQSFKDLTVNNVK